MSVKIKIRPNGASCSKNRALLTCIAAGLLSLNVIGCSPVAQSLPKGFLSQSASLRKNSDENGLNLQKKAIDQALTSAKVYLVDEDITAAWVTKPNHSIEEVDDRNDLKSKGKLGQIPVSRDAREVYAVIKLTPKTLSLSEIESFSKSLQVYLEDLSFNNEEQQYYSSLHIDIVDENEKSNTRPSRKARLEILFSALENIQLFYQITDAEKTELNQKGRALSPAEAKN